MSTWIRKADEAGQNFSNRDEKEQAIIYRKETAVFDNKLYIFGTREQIMALKEALMACNVQGQETSVTTKEGEEVHFITINLAGR